MLKILFYIIGYAILTYPTSAAISYFFKRWQRSFDEEEKKELDTDLKDGLKSAGKIIGILERMLIFTFIILGQYEAIGFLIAAKSIYRFTDLKSSSERKFSEYVLIGTLLSFIIAILVGIVIRKLISYFNLQ
jgi:hypothetical protein